VGGQVAEVVGGNTDVAVADEEERVARPGGEAGEVVDLGIEANGRSATQSL